MSHQHQDIPVAQFLGLIGLTWLIVGIAYSAPLHSAAPIWFWAVAFRLVGLLGAPVLEDDWYRYLWDGRVFAVTGNPYEKAPSAFFASTNLPPRFEFVLGQINNPDLPTIYGPVSQYAFLASYWISPGQLWPIKVILLIVDLGTMFLLSRVVRPKHLLFYAWCPLLIQETAFNAHPDILGILFMVAAVVCVIERRFMAAAIGCALAVGTKVFAILFVPLLLLRIPKKYWPLFPVALLAVYSPFVGQGSLADVAALKAFASRWEFNSTLFAVIANISGASAAKWICLFLFSIFYIYYAGRWHLNHTETIPRGDWVFGVFFLFSAVVNPWYLLWLLPFVAVFPSTPGVAALIVVTLSYVHGLNLPESGLRPYEHPLWVRWAEMVVLAAAGIAEVYVRRKPIP